MNIINKLKFFFKKLSIKEDEYDSLVQKSTWYDNMIKCAHINKKTETLNVKSGIGNPVISKFPYTTNCNCSVNIVELLRAGGIIFNDSVKWNITVNENNKEQKIENIAQKLFNYFGFSNNDGTYIYNLTRVKSAFNVGTMTLDDFEEVDDEFVYDLAKFIVENISNT